jgi:ABC-type branched-subunit amino acid transport system substrate-binding protein
MPGSARPVLVPGVALVTLAGCGGGGEPTKSSLHDLPKEIVIGATIAKTGYLAPYDGNITAIEQLVDEVNATGGVRGSRLRIVSVTTVTYTRKPLPKCQVFADICIYE